MQFKIFFSFEIPLAIIVLPTSKKLVSKPPLDVNLVIEILPILFEIGSPPNQWDFIT